MSNTRLETTTVSSSDLKAGDILAQNIGSYDSLKQGTQLTPSLIEQIQRLMGNKQISVDREIIIPSQNTIEKKQHQDL